MLSLPCSGSSPGPSGCRWSSSPWRLVLPWQPQPCGSGPVKSGEGTRGVGVAQGLWGQQTGPRAAKAMGSSAGGQAGWGFPSVMKIQSQEAEGGGQREKPEGRAAELLWHK